jgi:hypothetical protein
MGSIGVSCRRSIAGFAGLVFSASLCVGPASALPISMPLGAAEDAALTQVDMKKPAPGGGKPAPHPGGGGGGGGHHWAHGAGDGGHWHGGGGGGGAGWIVPGIAAGVIGAAAAAAAYGSAPPPPAPGMCWYYSDPSQTTGFWDYCH